MKKNVNTRCPFRGECEKKCEYTGRELECLYYKTNAVGDNVIPDQEELRRMLERQLEMEAFEAELAGPPENELVYISADEIHPHPDNPRKELGDLTELADSIRAKGVMQNLTVVPRESGEGYTVIIGHRRHAAAKLAGVTELPCVIVEMPHREQVATMLTENMQRVDLTVYEQAQGFQMMMDLGESVESISEKTGFSKTTVRRRLKMAELDGEILKSVSARQIGIDDLDKLSKIEDLSVRNGILKKIGTNNFEQSLLAALKKQAIEKNLPVIKELIRALRAKKIQRSETYGGKYVNAGKTVYLDEWHPGDPLLTAETGEKRVYYFLDEDYGKLNFYTERPKAKPVRRSKEELERERLAAETRAKLEELTKEAYELRRRFVSGLTVTKANETYMLKGAVAVAALHCTTYVSGAGSAAVESALGMESEPGYDPKRTEKILSRIILGPVTGYPQTIYAVFGDSETNSFFRGRYDAAPEWQENDELSALYSWLLLLGYEMSDDEEALLQGTHPLFACKDAPDGNVHPD